VKRPYKSELMYKDARMSQQYLDLRLEALSPAKLPGHARAHAQFVLWLGRLPFFQHSSMDGPSETAATYAYRDPRAAL
jgi:hypothetical protein